MRAIEVLLVAIAALAITSCIPSIHPIYDADTQVYDPALLGTWTSAEEDETWVFSPGLRQRNTYQLTQTDVEGNVGEFAVHLVEIGGANFIDLFPEDLEFTRNDLLFGSYFRIHTSMRVEVGESSLRLFPLEFSWLLEQLKSNTNLPEYVYTNQQPELLPEDDGLPIFTARTADLQAWLESIVDTPEAWDEPIELKREIEVVRDDWEVRIEGDKLYIDDESWLAKKSTDNGFPAPVFHRFDGVYPADWPEGFLLPDGCFLQKEKLELLDAANPDSQNAGGRLLRLTGLSPLSIEEAIDWFRNQGLAAGFSITSDYLESTQGYTAGEIDWRGLGCHKIRYENEGTRYPWGHIEIWLNQDLGGYAYITGTIIVNTNK